MRFAIALLLAAAGPYAAASPSPHRQHRHHHLEPRTDDNVVVIQQYQIGGQTVSLNEVCAGLKAGTLRLDDGTTKLDACNDSDAQAHDTQKSSSDLEVVHKKDPVTTPKPDPISTKQADGPATTPISTTPATTPTTTPTTTPAATTSSSPVSIKASETPSAHPDPVNTSTQKSSLSTYGDDNSHGGQGVDRDFPDGTIDCNDFPSEYGPIEIEYMKIGGWSGIQYPTFEGDLVSDIVTAVPGMQNCTIGAFCSYACPPGYQKTQWPSTQGKTKQSVGGLLCNNHGKLELTNPSLSRKLCTKGTGATQVENNLKKGACICRTDYPGTESQTVPLCTNPGTTSPLTCPDSKTYYQHFGDATTAQYYINNQGVARKDACSWNVDGSHEGNWAPTVLGVGRDIFGKTWLSISTTIDNKPKDYQPLDYDVEIVPIDDGKISGHCTLKDGKYCSGDKYEDCNDRGCTVQLMSGEAKYVLKDHNGIDVRLV